MADAITVLAPAKLNLALSVGGPDPDGMHPICTWMVTVSLYDELEVTSLEADRFSRYAILWHAEAKRCSESRDSTGKRTAAISADLRKRSKVAKYETCNAPKKRA